VARHGNKLLTEKEPWKLIKTDAEAAGVVLYDCFQIIANWAVMIEPFLPNASKVLKEKLNISSDLSWEHIGSQELVPSQTQIAPSFYLFTPIEDEVIAVQIEKLKAKTIKVEEVKIEETPKEIAPLKPEITFDDFAKLDLVMGTILEAEKVAKSDKLLKFQVDLGFEVRTIVSGVALHFAPEALLGKQVMVVANLAPRKIMGVESRGMILFADNEGKLIRMSGDEAVSNGSRVS
jgi:methionyl-tRNA synthetase